MKYAIEYLEDEYDIIKQGDEYSVPMTWTFTNNYKEDFVYIFNKDKLNRLNVEEDDFVWVSMVDLDNVQVWANSDYKNEIYLCTDGEYLDEWKNKERMINAIANHFKNIPNVTIVFREFCSEEYVEGLVDYLEGKIVE